MPLRQCDQTSIPPGALVVIRQYPTLRRQHCHRLGSHTLFRRELNRIRRLLAALSLLRLSMTPNLCYISPNNLFKLINPPSSRLNPHPYAQTPFDAILAYLALYIISDSKYVIHEPPHETIGFWCFL